MLLDSLHPIVAFQKKLYFEYLKRVGRITGKSKSSLSKYEREFKEGLPEDHYPSSKKKFLAALEESDVILFGDFHTLMNSQNLLIESLRSYREFDEKAEIIIALEAFDSKDKKKLELYMKEELSEEEFLAKTKYYEKWCFPWFHYKKIFDVAKEFSFSIVPVNSSLKKSAERDEAIAKNILKHLKGKKGEAKVFCLIGEFHLAENHLGLQLQKLKKKKTELKVTRVLSNVDEYFFNHKFRRVPGSEKYLSLDMDYYCLINTPPWIKWYTYLQWEDDVESDCFEIREGEGLSPFDYVLFDTTFDDVEFLLGELTRRLASFFKVSVYLKDFYHYKFQIFSEEENVKEISPCKVECEFLLSSLPVVDYGICCEKKSLFYSSVTLGSLVASCGAVLFSMKSGRKKAGESLESFSRVFLRGAFSALCELIFNPYAHTKLNSEEKIPRHEFLSDMEAILRFLEKKESGATEREVLLFMKELAQERVHYWGHFFRYCAHRMFERLFHDSSFFISFIQKDLLKRKPRNSFKKTLENYLKVAITP